MTTSREKWLTISLICCLVLFIVGWQSGGITYTNFQNAPAQSGAIILLINGTCNAGWTEVTTLNGKFLKGTIAANGNVGTTGGNATIIPAGTITQPTLIMNSYTPLGSINTPTFTGSALANHAHELPYQLSTSTQSRQIAAATFGTGTSRVSTGAVTFGATAVSAPVALSQAVSAGTPIGTISALTFTGNNNIPTGTVSKPTFSGTSIDPSPAFINVIFCRKN